MLPSSPVVARIAPATLGPLYLEAALSRDDATLVVAAMASHGALDGVLAQVYGALSPAERSMVVDILRSRAPLTVEQRRRRHSRDSAADAIAEAAAYIRVRLESGDHVQQRDRLAAPAPVAARSLVEILIAEVRAGRVTSINLECDDAADMAVRLGQLEDAGCLGGMDPTPIESAGGSYLVSARYTEGVQIGVTTRPTPTNEAES